MTAKHIPATVDPLSGLAPLLRVRPELQDLCLFSQSWASPHAPEAAGWAPFHIVTRGTCVLDREGAAPLALREGDVVILPGGEAHVMRSAAARGPARPVRARPHGGVRLRTNVEGETDAESEVICGRLRFEPQPARLIPAILPPAVVMRTDAVTAPRMRMLVLAIRDELTQARAGADAIATDLASALLVMVVRAQLERDATGGRVLTLLAHPATARAVAVLVADPGRAWTLDALSRHAHVSRATLVRAFRRTAGVAPLAFLAEVRLGLARHRLATTAAPLGQVAAEVGYASESAFSRAFRRRFGERPGAARRDASADAQTRPAAT